MKKFATLLAALATLAGAGAAHAATELVINGSFEADAIPDAVRQVSSVTGWTSSIVGGNAFEIQKGATQGGIPGFNTVAADGVQYLELNTDRYTTISQTLSTTVGGIYTLSFAYSGRPNTADGANSAMNVYWGNTLLTPTPLLGNTTGTWQTFSQSLTALDAATTLRFESVGPSSSPSFGSYLDNVSVVSSVPEPGTYAMLLLGLVGCVARRKRAA